MPSLVRSKQAAVKKAKAPKAKKLKSDALPKTKKPKTPRKPTEKLRVKTRGKYRNVAFNGASLPGMHPSLFAAIGRGFNYDDLVKKGTLCKTTTPCGNVAVVERSYDVKNKSKLQNSKRLGIRMDTQVTAIVKWHTGKYKVPLKAFFDSTERNLFAARQWGKAPIGKGKEYEKERKRFRNTCSGMMNETEQLLRYLHSRKMNPVATQVPVHWNKSLGTPVDLVCTQLNSAGVLCDRVIELKKGCENSFSHGKTMWPIYPDVTFSTHNEHLLQTMMNDKLYRKTHPGRVMGPPELIRIDPKALHAYSVPAWALKQEHALAAAMKCDS
jgi:hypothetical protein